VAGYLDAAQPSSAQLPAPGGLQDVLKHFRAKPTSQQPPLSYISTRIQVRARLLCPPTTRLLLQLPLQRYC
jgi:hypothetical protein